jgi:phosphoenolpyruvate synthase/pyruvate phosphate dikinase
MDKFCLPFVEISRRDVPLAGGKGANLGDMVQAGLPVPPGFVITAAAYRQMFESSGLASKVCDCLQFIDREDNQALMEVEHEIRALFQQESMDPVLCTEILEHYYGLGENIPVAVRSSATAEDLVGPALPGSKTLFSMCMEMVTLFRPY